MAAEEETHLWCGPDPQAVMANLRAAQPDDPAAPAWLGAMTRQLGCCSACVVTYHMFRHAAEETEEVVPPYTRSELYRRWAAWDRQRLLPSLGMAIVPGGVGPGTIPDELVLALCEVPPNIHRRRRRRRRRRFCHHR